MNAISVEHAVGVFIASRMKAFGAQFFLFLLPTSVKSLTGEDKLCSCHCADDELMLDVRALSIWQQTFEIFVSQRCRPTSSKLLAVAHTSTRQWKIKKLS